MIGKVVTGCVAILPYHTATQDRGSECCDFGFISRIVTALVEKRQYTHMCECITSGLIYYFTQFHRIHSNASHLEAKTDIQTIIYLNI